MSGTVIPFPQRDDPTLEGEAICIDCGHLWHAVVAVGVAHLECPVCLTDSGRLRYPVLRDGDHWQCRCGGTLFRVTRDMIYCADCGLEQCIRD